MLQGGRDSERAHNCHWGCSEERCFVRHKPKKSDAKRAERSMPKPKAKPATVGKEKPASKPPASGEAGPD
jgi:hypothetical protein